MNAVQNRTVREIEVQKVSSDGEQSAEDDGAPAEAEAGVIRGPIAERGPQGCENRIVAR
jgi:hypothetical protein